MLKLDFNPFPELHSERLLFRRILKSDANELYALRSDERVMRYIDRPYLTSEKEALELISKIDENLVLNDGINWGICLKPDNKLVGTIGFWRIDQTNYRGEIGYMLTPELQGQGLMKEALRYIIPYGFNGLKLHSIEANVNPENLASKKLLEHCGFVKEAYFRENYYYDGKFIDSLIYCLLQSDLK